MEFKLNYTVSKEFLKAGRNILSYLPFSWAKNQVRKTNEVLDLLNNNCEDGVLVYVYFNLTSQAFASIVFLLPVYHEIVDVLKKHSALIRSTFLQVLKGARVVVRSNDPDAWVKDYYFDGSKLS